MNMINKLSLQWISKYPRLGITIGRAATACVAIFLPFAYAMGRSGDFDLWGGVMVIILAVWVGVGCLCCIYHLYVEEHYPQYLSESKVYVGSIDKWILRHPRIGARGLNLTLVSLGGVPIMTILGIITHDATYMDITVGLLMLVVSMGILSGVYDHKVTELKRHGVSKEGE